MARYTCPDCGTRWELSDTEHCPGCGRAWFEDYDHDDEEIATDGGCNNRFVSTDTDLSLEVSR